MNDKNKKNIILTIIAVTTLIAVVGGATYAYFAADLGGGSSANINATTGTTDSLSFSTGDRISIYADLENFAKNKENLTDNATATATLKPNNTTNQAEGKYNIFFIIEENSLIYTTEDKTPELLLKVTDPEGNVINSIVGLNGTNGEFDITTRIGSFLIARDYAISTNTAEGTAQNWNVEVTLVNLDANQNANMGKSLTGLIYITTEDQDTYKLAEINKLNATTTYSSIKADLEVTKGTTEIDKYYFGKEEVSNPTAFVTPKVMKLANTSNDIEYIETTDASYEFTDLKENATYKIYSYVVDKNGIKSNTYETEIRTDNYVLPSITSIVSEVTTDSIKVVVSASKGSNEVAKYYFSKDNGATYTTGQTSNEYTFTGLDAGTGYQIKIQVEDAKGRKSTEYYEAIETEVAGITCASGTNFASCIKDNFVENGAYDLYYHDSTLANSAEDNSYRYSGSNPNNYVCFGSDEATCPEDNLYRIIGVFDGQIKLIKADYADSTLLGTNGAYYSSTIFDSEYVGNNTINYTYWWSSENTNSNVWSKSILNKTNLNTNFINNIGSVWTSKISTNNWYSGGINADNISYKEVKNLYQYELGSKKSNTTYNAKIGLIYISDYGYASSPENWNEIINSSKLSKNNWIYLGESELLLTSATGGFLGLDIDKNPTTWAYIISYSGEIYVHCVYKYSNASAYSLRPTFYLNSNVAVIGGSGTSADPYRIS